MINREIVYENNTGGPRDAGRRSRAQGYRYLRVLLCCKNDIGKQFSKNLFPSLAICAEAFLIRNAASGPRCLHTLLSLPTRHQLHILIINTFAVIYNLESSLMTFNYFKYYFKYYLTLNYSNIFLSVRSFKLSSLRSIVRIILSPFYSLNLPPFPQLFESSSLRSSIQIVLLPLES